MSEKGGQANLPMRQASGSSDIAIPTSDPNDVSSNFPAALGLMEANRYTLGFKPFGRTVTSLEACSWISGGVRGCYRKAAQDTGEGIREGFQGQQTCFGRVDAFSKRNSPSKTP
jgi:hypothetical protein